MPFCGSRAAAELHLSQASRRGESFHRVPLCPLTPGRHDGMGEVWSRQSLRTSFFPLHVGSDLV